ncbi:uncharacterized protein METZ01_LOCUS228024 [marine metagenome]|uniref:Uncharacterized protein n=1 Tax=marine metagenome TaxID=408172 RepID=A0A382GJ41_9ZZZZ
MFAIVDNLFTPKLAGISYSDDIVIK